MDYDRRHFSYLARYNRAANETLIGHLAALGAGDLTKARGSYFGSMQGILDHVMAGDMNWLRRFRSLFPGDESLNRPRLSPPGAAWTPYSWADFGEYRRARAEVDAIFQDWIALTDTERLGETLAYMDSHGQPKAFTARDALDHVFNHQTHHRGQVSQILDELGVAHDFSNLISSAEKPASP